MGLVVGEGVLCVGEGFFCFFVVVGRILKLFVLIFLDLFVFFVLKLFFCVLFVFKCIILGICFNVFNVWLVIGDLVLVLFLVVLKNLKIWLIWLYGLVDGLVFIFLMFLLGIVRFFSVDNCMLSKCI